MSSDLLSPHQFRGLLRLGDVVIPGEGDLPSFTDSGTAAAIDRMLPYMHEADRDSLLVLLSVCAFLPRLLIRGVVGLATHGERAPGPLAALLRMANIGIKGVVCSLYYSDVAPGAQQGRIHQAIGWDPVIVDPEADAR